MRSISLADGCTVFDVFWFVLNCNCLVDDGTSDSALHGSGFDLKFDHKLQVQASYKVCSSSSSSSTIVYVAT